MDVDRLGSFDCALVGRWFDPPCEKCCACRMSLATHGSASDTDAASEADWPDADLEKPPGSASSDADAPSEADWPDADLERPPGSASSASFTSARVRPFVMGRMKQSQSMEFDESSFMAFEKQKKDKEKHSEADDKKQKKDKEEKADDKKQKKDKEEKADEKKQKKDKDNGKKQGEDKEAHSKADEKEQV